MGSKSITALWVNGLATAILRGDEGSGIATVTASDYQTVQALVTILGEGPVPPENSTNDVIGMQETGIPVYMLILAILMVFGGLLVPKRK